MRYYYMQDPDSLRIYLKIAEPLFIATNRIEELCRAKGWNIYSLANEGMQGLVIREVDSLRNLATCFNYPDGVDMANQALANFYFNIGLDEEGILLSREILSRMEERNASRMRWYYVLRLLLTKDLRLEYLNKLDSCIQECEKEGITQLDAEHTVAFLKDRYHYYSAQYYVAEKEPSLVYQHLRMMEDIEKKNNMNAEQILPQFLWMNYYALAGKYEKAIDLANKLELMLLDKKRFNDWVSVEDFKADLYYKLGRGMEAARAYRDSKEVHDSIMRVKYYEDLAKLKTQREVEKLEIQSKKLELEAEKSRVRILMLRGGFVLVLFLCAGLGIVAYARHRAGIRLKIAKEKAEEADHLKSAFLANMNHEIRTPLNAIVGFSSLMQGEELSQEERAEYCAIVVSNSEMLLTLLNDILDISSLECGKIRFNYASEDIVQICQHVMMTTAHTRQRGVEGRFACPVGSFMLTTDAHRLSQILINLLTNAGKFTSEGSITLGVEIDEERGEVLFSVADTGPGIPPDKQDLVFNRFEKLDGNKKKGTGLGLAICRQIAMIVGGRIWVDSAYTGGTRFVFAQPIGIDPGGENREGGGDYYPMNSASPTL